MTEERWTCPGRRVLARRPRESIGPVLEGTGTSIGAVRTILTGMTERDE
jgi:hypothetical protein